MNNKVRVFSKLSFFAVVPLFLLTVLFSCNNVITDNTKNTHPIQPDNVKTVTITGYVRNPYAESGNSRAAFPSASFSDTRYFVTATTPGVAGEVTGTANATTFSIPLALGKVWTLMLTMQKKEDGDTDYKTVMQTSYTINHALTETDVTTPLTLELKPLMTENGTGKIELSFSSSPTGLYDNVSVEIGNLAQKAAWDDAVLVSTSGISMKTGQDDEPCKMPCGVYSVTLSFFRNGALVYATTQEINVFDDMTTSRWVDGSTQNTPISNGSFILTESDINRFKYTNYFVASSTSSPAGDNGNSGSPYAPLATVSEALRRIAETGTASDEYTIWLMSDITDNVEMSGSDTDGLDGKASSITIKPWRNGSATLSVTSGRVLSVFTTVPVTLENLTITGGSTSVSGGGMYIDSSAKVTLANCTVTGNSVTGSGLFSGGIYNVGTLKVKGKVTVTGNTTGSGSSAAASNVYLASGKTITVIDTLDPDSRIGVTTQTKPSYGSPVAFTSGFVTNSGLEAAAISTIFTGDEGYSAVAGTGTNAGEATLAASGGSLSDAFDYAVTLSCEAENIVPGSIITVAAAVTNGGTAVTPAAEDITWNFELICYGEHVATMQGASLVGYGAVRIPSNIAIYEGVPYTLHVTATYKNVGYDADFELTGNSDSLSAQGFVAVAGATVSGAVADSVVFIAGRTVTIPNLYVCDHEVTQAEFAAVMENNTSNFDGSNNNETVEGEKQKNRPVESVSWFNMLVYCNKRSSADGLTECYTINGSTDPDDWGEVPTPEDNTNYAAWNAVSCDFNANGYRLPTEAEWEYLARGGNNGIPTTQTTYSGSNTVGNVAWYHDNSGNKSHEVRKKTANSLGLYDMSGNVWEWCWDWLGDITSNTPATGVSSGSARVSRGGSWYNNASYSAVSYRNSNNPLNQYSSAGFRVVRTNKAPVALPAGTNGTAGTAATYILFGEWPQTIKASGVTVDEDISKQMGAFTYYFGSDGAWYVKLAEKAYETGYMYSDGTPVAQSSDETYKYFKVEPIKWRVLTTNYNGTGNKLLLAENILINHCYDPSSNNYANSEIRSYLNGDFFNSAFTSAMQSKIVTTTVNNSASTTDNSSNAYACENTDEKIFLLSYKEAENVDYDYGFADASNRVRMNTDFAKANGAFASTSNGQGGYWWLRSPYSDNAGRACNIHRDGSMSSNNFVSDGYRGIVPALCIDN